MLPVAPHRLASLVLVSLLGACATGAPDDSLYQVGRSDYEAHCARCHGLPALPGAGGPPAPRRQDVSDLTTLSRRNDGIFPMLQVTESIDGRAGLGGHAGESGMPTWGRIFFDQERAAAGPGASVAQIEAAVQKRNWAIAQFVYVMQAP